MRLIQRACLLVTVLGTGCATAPIQMPPNVAVIQGAQGASYIDKATFKHTSKAPVPFAKVKLCVAENVANDAVTLRDSVGSFVGPATKNYYQSNNTQTIGAGPVFKYVDDSQATLIANGTTVANDGGVMITDFVRYEAKAVASGNDVLLTFYAITRAQQNTGTLSNDGFSPVGIWPGSRAESVYRAIERVAARVQACMT